MSRVLAPILLVMLVIAIGGCGGEDTTSNDANLEKPALTIPEGSVEAGSSSDDGETGATGATDTSSSTDSGTDTSGGAGTGTGTGGTDTGTDTGGGTGGDTTGGDNTGGVAPEG